MIKAVIIDDEEKARNLIESIIKNSFNNIEVCAKASSVIEGIKAINNHNPEIVLLDIEMQDGTGFDLLDALPDRKFSFMFITAYNQYAIKAFKYSAIDYITKPIDIEDFIAAIERMLEKIHLKSDLNLQILKENLSEDNPKKIAIPSLKGFEYIKVKDIVKLKADGRYSKISLINKREITASKSLGEFQELLDSTIFFKPHKSFLININYVKMYVKHDGGSIIMEDDSNVLLSRNNKDEFMNIMKQLTSKS